MRIIQEPLPGVKVIEPQVLGDDRGFFMETFNADKFAALGLPTDFKQDNHSSSAQGVLRGLHFQLPPKAMGKLVRCTRGRLWDVVVDLRKFSPTYKQSFGIELSAQNKLMMYFPPGFGHGFYSLEDNELVYKCTETFDSSLDANVAWNDPEFKINWPLTGDPTLSARDQAAPMFKDLKLPF